MAQINFFDGNNKFIIDRPIRLIELFGGYGSQAFALKYLGANFEQWKLCEWAVKSIQAYKDAHCENDNTDYSKDLTDEQVINYLFNKGISQNYNEPMTYEQIKRLGSQKQRQIYNNIMATHNLVNIQQVKGSDLEIVDTDKYCYVMTYSFPCQDLSSAGLGKGMEKGSGTRSGMLWEVERILDEIKNENKELPQVLLMENVPEVIGVNNIKHFAKWLEKLESLGYRCYWEVLNAKDYGIPQNRERCFMVSVLGDYFYEFPEKIKLEHKLKDLLEQNVNEKFYLSDKMKEYIKAENGKWTGNDDKSIINRDIGVTINTRVGNTRADCSDYICDELPPNYNLKNEVIIKGKNYPITKENENFIELEQKGFLDSDCRAWKDNKISGTLTTNGKIKICETNLKTQLCNDLIANGKVQEYDVIRHSYSTSRMENWKDRNVEQNNISPTLDTRCDCLGVVVNSNNKRLKDLVNKMDLTKDNQFLNIYNQPTSENSETITTRVDASNSTAVYTDYRIRKLTPRECFRLMGVKDKDFEKIAQNQSNASLYHLAGDSIVVDVLISIFKEFLC